MLKDEGGNETDEGGLEATKVAEEPHGRRVEPRTRKGVGRGSSCLCFFSPHPFSDEKTEAQGD